MQPLISYNGPLMRVLAALLLAASPAAAQVTLKSDHYDLKTSGTREQGQGLLDFMELVHKTYSALLKPANPAAVAKRRFTLVLFRTRGEYVKAGGPPSSGAFYNGRELVGWYDPVWMRSLFAHEGMHQFTDATSANYRAFPMWFSEGIADCIGNCEVRKGKLYLCVRGGMIARLRLGLIQAAIRKGATYPVGRFLGLGRREFMANATLCYAQAWSFCHFLITYPKREDRAHQIPNGRFRRNLAIYYELIRAGKVGHDEAWAAAFRGIPMDKLEALWKGYVLALDPGKFIGIRGAELNDEEVAGLKLGRGESGIRVAQVNAGSVAEQGGIKPGDILVAFDRNKFPRHGALDRLRVWVQEVPYGRIVRLTVLRNGEKVECRCVWKKAKK